MVVGVVRACVRVCVCVSVIVLTLRLIVFGTSGVVFDYV